MAKRNMAEVGEVDVDTLDAEFSTITLDGLKVKIPKPAVEDILSGGPSALLRYTVLPSSAL